MNANASLSGHEIEADHAVNAALAQGSRGRGRVWHPAAQSKWHPLYPPVPFLQVRLAHSSPRPSTAEECCQHAPDPTERVPCRDGRTWSRPDDLQAISIVPALYSILQTRRENIGACAASAPGRLLDDCCSHT